ncbi:MAG TPA: translation initiation factor IF-2 [Chitinophagaceae bacterium]
MSEVNTPRLMAAAREFNIAKDTLSDFLESKGFSHDDLQGNVKLTEDMYRVLQTEFQQDKAAKQKAEQIDLPKNAIAESKRKRDEEDLSIKKKEAAKIKETPPPPVEEIKEEKIETPQPEPPKPTPEITKIEAPEIEQPKVIDKIDLSTIDSSTKPKKKEKAAEKKEEIEEKPKAPVKAAKKKEEAAPEKVEPKPEIIEPIPVAIIPEPPKDEAPIIENIKADKLEGPKIMGKIVLPVHNETRPMDEKRKRKRIPVDQKKVGNAPTTNFQRGPGGQGQGRPPGGQRPPSPYQGNRPQGGGGGRFNRNAPAVARRDDKEIDQKEIQDKIRETQAKLAGSGGRGKSLKAKYRKAKRDEAAELQSGEAAVDNKLQLTEFISVSEFANLMDVSFADVISKCMSLGIMVSINQRLEADVIELVAGEFGYEVEFIGIDDEAELEEEIPDTDEELVPRPPIVTIMGHVDHGKTSLLDYIRHANVIAGEAGGITQHIGAYEVMLKDGRAITFLDTPGHEAFTAMRARGAKVTDIAVIVIAADDAVMPQTKEAISHAQAANVPMIFAFNKIDKDGANPEKIKEQLAGMNILVESWGGKYQSQEISAKSGLNVDELLDKILLEAELQYLKANPAKGASGTVIEASLDKGRGYVATILVQNGTLRQGDLLVSGQNYGRVKAMFNERNQRTEVAPPATPVLILGLNGAPQAGETFKVYDDESEAKETANRRAQILREQGIRAKKHITLDEIGRRLALGNFKQLNLLIRADVDGSVEALSDSLQKLSTEEIAVSVVHKGVGQITESDVLLATASDAVIIGFNVRPALSASKLAEHEGVEIKTYSIIYDAIDEVKSAMEGMLEPKIQEKVLGVAEIKETYKFDKATVAGCMVLDGKVARNNRIRLVRDGIIVHTGELGSLKRFKDDAKEVTTNMECGMIIKNYNDIKPGDMIEAFEEVEVKRTL